MIFSRIIHYVKIYFYDRTFLSGTIKYPHIASSIEFLILLIIS